jgi:uncharacterized iron-regulated membrane protein
MTSLKYGLRATWFQVHKWLGLLLAILIVPIAVSGAALVWHDALDRLVNPARYALSAVPGGGPATLEFSRYAAAAATVLAPGERISSIRLAEHAGPVVVTAARPTGPVPGARPVRTVIWLDPATAAVLDHSDSASGLVRTLHVLHGSLLVPGVGRQIVGWIGVALLVSSISGLWLWWPVTGRWLRGLRWRRQRHFDANLHHLAGFWVMVPLAVLSLTGVWISFPQVFARLSAAEAAARPVGNPAARFRAQPLVPPVQEIDAVVARVVARIDGRPYLITWPTDQRSEWTVSLQQDAGAAVEVSVDHATGHLRRQTQGNEGLARTMRELHDGTGYGGVWQTIIFAAGLLPAALAVTGFIMWWRMRVLRQRVVVSGSRP